MLRKENREKNTIQSITFMSLIHLLCFLPTGYDNLSTVLSTHCVLVYIEMTRCDAAMRSKLRALAADVEMSDNIRSCMQLEFPSWQIRVKTVLKCTYFCGDYVHILVVTDWLAMAVSAKAAGSECCIGPVWIPSPASRGFCWYKIMLGRLDSHGSISTISPMHC